MIAGRSARRDPVVFAEEFLLVFDVSDEVATAVAAGPLAVWEAMLGADPIEVGRRASLAGLPGTLEMARETAEDARAAAAGQAR
jgi:hypothetical protein